MGGKALLRRLARRIVGADSVAGGAVVPQPSVPPSHAFSRMFERLAHAAGLGFSPKVIVDVGASNGRWTRDCMKVFPDANYYCIEALLENEAELQDLVRENGRVRYRMNLVGAADGSGVINVDGAGSSILKGHWGNPYGTQRSLPMRSLDSLIDEGWLAPPTLLKMDVQGYEIEVLKGAGRALQSAQGVIAEVSFISFQDGMPVAGDVMAFLRDRDFVCYDILSLATRPLDGALAQADLFFVRTGNPLRSSNRWDATSEY